MENFFIALGVTFTIIYVAFTGVLIIESATSYKLIKSQWDCTSYSVEQQRCVKYERMAE